MFSSRDPRRTVIRSQLEAIGKAGQDAFKKFSDAGAANALLARFGTTIDAIKAKAEQFGASARPASA